jgi:hypothetical protein
MPRRAEKKTVAAEVADRFKEAGLDRMTVDDVVQMLEKEGVRDLRQLVKRQLERAKASREALRSVDILGPSVRPSSRPVRQIIHREPAVPVLIDGVLYDPKDIHRFDGQLLHFVTPTLGRSELLAYTGDQWPQALRTYIQIRNVSALVGVLPASWVPGEGSSAGNPNGGVVIYPPTKFFKDSNFGGDWLWLGVGKQYLDLTKVGRGDFYDRGNWNDQITSVQPNPLGLTVLCEDVELGGMSATVVRYCPDLAPFGWSDRASSLVVWNCSPPVGGPQVIV